MAARRQSILASILLALIITVGASAASSKWYLNYGGVSCNKGSGTDAIACSLSNGRGYAVSISSREILVDGPLGAPKNGLITLTKVIFSRHWQPTGTAAAVRETRDRLVTAGVLCQGEPSGPGIKCVPLTGSGYGFEMTKSQIFVLNLDTQKRVFVRFTKGG